MSLAFQCLEAYKLSPIAIKPWISVMRTEELKSAIGKLEVAEKLVLIEEIWDDIAKSNEELPLPEWQKRELSRRLSAYDQGETETKDFHQVHEALRTKYK